MTKKQLESEIGGALKSIRDLREMIYKLLGLNLLDSYWEDPPIPTVKSIAERVVRDRFPLSKGGKEIYRKNEFVECEISGAVLLKETAFRGRDILIVENDFDAPHVWDKEAKQMNYRKEISTRTWLVAPDQVLLSMSGYG